MVWSINDRDRINLYQVAWGHRRYSDHYVCWFVISEQRYLGLFDDRDVFVAFVIDDVDCDLADLLRPGAGSSKRTAEIAKRQARLSRKITMANELPCVSSGCWPETNTNLVPVATTTWVYISGIGRSSGLMHSSVIDWVSSY